MKTLSQDCNFKALTAEQAKDEFIMDAFINEILSHKIKQRLLENKTLNLITV